MVYVLTVVTETVKPFDLFSIRRPTDCRLLSELAIRPTAVRFKSLQTRILRRTRRRSPVEGGCAPQKHFALGMKPR